MRTSIKRISMKSQGVIITLLPGDARGALHVGGPKDAIYLCELLERLLFNGAPTYFSGILPRALSRRAIGLTSCWAADARLLRVSVSGWVPGGGLPLLRLAPADGLQLRPAPARAAGPA